MDGRREGSTSDDKNLVLEFDKSGGSIAKLEAESCSLTTSHCFTTSKVGCFFSQRTVVFHALSQHCEHVCSPALSQQPLSLALHT